MVNVEICDKCNAEMAYEEFVGWWCPKCDTVGHEEDLGFGAVANCQTVIGIECVDCGYHEACVGSD